MSKVLSTAKRKQHWQQIIEQWQQSGKTIASFCRERELTVSSFYHWRNQLFPKEIEHSAVLPQPQRLFVPISAQKGLGMTTHDAQTIKLSLQYPNGCTLHLEGAINDELLRCFSKAMGV